MDGTSLFPQRLRSLGRVGSGSGITNLVPNGDFSTNDLTGWTLNANATGNVSAATGVAIFDDSHGDYASMSSTGAVEIGKEYGYSFDIVAQTSPVALVYFGVGGVSVAVKNCSIVTDETITGTATATNTTAFQLQVRTNGSIGIDNVVVWEV